MIPAVQHINRAVSQLSTDHAALIRDMLLIGLSSYGEIERLTNAATTARLCGEHVPADLAALHPTGDADTISKFADALMLIVAIENPTPVYDFEVQS